MTPEEIKRLRELHEAASPGVWTVNERATIPQIGFGDVDLPEWKKPPAHYFSDAECIAATHNALPQLLNEIERLQALVGLPADASLQEQHRYHVRRSGEILVKSLEEKYGN